MGQTGQVLIVRTEGLGPYQTFPAFRQTVVTPEGQTLLAYEVTKLYEGYGWSCAQELAATNTELAANIKAAVPAGDSAKTNQGPELVDIINCLKANGQDCTSSNHSQLQLAHDMTPQKGAAIIDIIHQGAVEFTVSEGGSTSVTYYYLPETGQIYPVLDGGC